MNRDGGVGQPGSGSNMPVSGGGVEDLHVGEKQVKHIVADRDIVRDLKDHFFPSFTDDAIVDVRITVAKEGSIIEKQLNDLKYEKILPSPTVSSPAAVKQFTTFNNGINLWVWRKKQGNFDGRLKPIIGMILSPLATSTILVCQGYLRLEESIGSQYLWIKRAADIYEENALAIIDLKVTSGKLKDKASALYMSPGQGFVQLEGNFTPDTIIGTILSNNAPDTFLWYLIRSEENAALHTASVHALVDAGHGERSAMLNAVKENAKKAVLAAAKQSRARKLMSFFSLSGSKSNFSMSAGSAKDLDANCISYGTLLNVTRLAVRNYVPWTLRFYSTVPTISFDFSELFHSFTNKMGEMSLSKFKKMLVSIGLYFSGREGNTLFYLFNRSANTSIKAVDFIAMLSFTGYEVDCICEAIKRRILLSVNYVESTSPTASVSSNYLTIAQKQLISSLFELVDSNNDGILAREDFRSLTTALGLHLSEYEINLVINYIFTLNNKNSEIMTIDVKDFLNFIEMESNLLYHRAHRVYHTQNKLRLWLKQMADKGNQSSVAHTKQVISQLYVDLGKRNYLADVGEFDNVLLPQHMMMLLVGLEVNLYVDEVYLLCSIIVPHKSVLHITQDDLISFTSQQAYRSFGELIIVIEKKLLVQSFKQFAVYKSNKANDTLFTKLFDEVTEHVKAKGGCTINKDNEHLLIATTTQLKNGVENYANITISETSLPTLGEWAVLSLISDCIVTANPVAAASSPSDTSFGGNHLISGIAVNQFLMGLLVYRHHKHHNHSMLLESVVRKLVHMLRQQAKASSGAKNTYNYQAVFDLFDGDLSGNIDVDEFRGMLMKYNLLGANIKENLHLITDLIALFDRRSRGYITYDDFLNFIDSNRDLVGDLDSDEDDSDDEEGNDPTHLGVVPTDPPIKVTASHESDCLLWHIWKEAMKVDPADPEGVINSLLDMCNNVSDPVSVKYNIDIKSTGKGNGSISAGSLWTAIEAVKLRGAIGIVQYNTGVQYFKHDVAQHSKAQYNRLYFDSSKNGMADPVDYIGFCRAIVKMGLSYTAKDNNQRVIDESRYYNLWHALVKELCSLKFSTDAYEGQLYHVDSPKDPFTSTISSDLSATSSSAASSHINTSLKSLPRFAKAFYRLDHDGDGCITVEEFKKALKKLKIYSIRDWPAHYLHRLFEEFAASSGAKGKGDSVLNIDAFVTELLSSKDYNDVHKQASLPTQSSNSFGNTFRGTSTLDTYFDEDFRPVDYDSNSDIFEKIRKVLGASIVYPNPVDTFGSSLQRSLGNTNGLDIPVLKNAFDTHTETIVESVRAYFDKYHNKARNTYNTDIVSEEVFQTFARKSGILNALTTVEYNSLLKRVKKYNVSKQVGNSNTTYIDINKFCKRLLLCGDCRQYNLERISERASREHMAVPYSMGEAILLKLQEAAIASSAVGRDFLALCRLIDSQNNGKITTSEFIHVVKMMSVVITKADTHALLELLPSSGPYAVDIALSKRSNLIDYLAIHRLIHERLPPSLPPPINATGVRTAMRYFNENNDVNSLPQLLSDTATGAMAASTGSMDKLFRGSLPRYANRSNNKTDVGLILSRSVDSGNPVQRTSAEGPRKVHFSIDFDKTIPTASGYSIAAPIVDLSDPLDVRVNVPAYQRMMSSVFRRIKVASDSISRQHAVPFNLTRQCAVFDPADTGYIPIVAFQNILLSTLQISLTASDFYALSSMYNRVEDQRIAYKVFYNDYVTATLHNISQITPIGYDNNRLVQRYNQLMIEGKDPKKLFMLHDMDLSGLVSQSDFRKVVSDLQLMRSEHQYIKCVNEYSCISDNAYINYEDFCNHIELISREVS